MSKLDRLLKRLEPKQDKYVIAQCTSTRLNPMFKRPTPLAWHHIIERTGFDRYKEWAEKQWPDVAVTLVERKTSDR